MVSQGKGRVEFDFSPTSNPACASTFSSSYCGDNGISVRITSTNPANPLRNLRLVMPGFEATAARQPFHPWFLKSLERYSVSRRWPLLAAAGLDACPPAGSSPVAPPMTPPSGASHAAGLCTCCHCRMAARHANFGAVSSKSCSSYVAAHGLDALHSQRNQLPRLPARLPGSTLAHPSACLPACPATCQCNGLHGCYAALLRCSSHSMLLLPSAGQVLRFMDWMDTGSAAPRVWATRNTPQHDTQARPTGVALEHIVSLCNQVGAAPWINVHHLADDAYVASLAQFLQAQLRPDLKVRQVAPAHRATQRCARNTNASDPLCAEAASLACCQCSIMLPAQKVHCPARQACSA